MASPTLNVYLHLAAALAALALGYTVWHWRQKKKASHITFWVIFLLFLLIGWGLMEYYAQKAEQGIVVCEDPVQQKNCVIAMHIHSMVYGSVCGEEINMPREHGPLDATHTHKESNRFHWHDTLSWDEHERKLLDDTPLQLGESFKGIGIELTDSCIKLPGSPRFCTGDSCPGSITPGKLLVWRQHNEDTPNEDNNKNNKDDDKAGQGEELSSWQNIPWKDEETWEIVFE